MRSILVGVAFAVLATGASAQDKRPDYGAAINAAGAKKIAAGVVSSSWTFRNRSSMQAR